MELARPLQKPARSAAQQVKVEDQEADLRSARTQEFQRLLSVPGSPCPETMTLEEAGHHKTHVWVAIEDDDGSELTSILWQDRSEGACLSAGGLGSGADFACMAAIARHPTPGPPERTPGLWSEASWAEDSELIGGLSDWGRFGYAIYTGGVSTRCKSYTGWIAMCPAGGGEFWLKRACEIHPDKRACSPSWVGLALLWATGAASRLGRLGRA